LTSLLIATLFFSGCEYAVTFNANKKLVRAMDGPKALTNIRSGLTSSNHQSGCDQYSFFHKTNNNQWRSDIGTPEQATMAGSVIRFYANLKNQNDKTPWTSQPLEVNLDVTKIDHVIAWERPGRNIAAEGEPIEIDFDRGYELSGESHFTTPSATLKTNHILYCGIAKENIGVFFAAIRYLNPNAHFVGAR
jgi:hypothetical protein